MREKSYIHVRMTNEAFKTAIRKFLAESGMAASSFGRSCVNDPGFVKRIMDGSECRESTRDRVLAWMAANPPEAAQRAGQAGEAAE